MAYPEHPNGVGFPGPRGYFPTRCQFLTIFSPYGANASLNKLLLPLLFMKDLANNWSTAYNILNHRIYALPS